MRTFPVKDYTPIEDGKHKGKIVKIDYRDEPYQYVDLYMTVDDVEGMEIKYGCPQNITTSSKFGKLLINFGVDLVPGSEINEEEIRKALLDKEVSYMTITETVIMKDKSKKEFARVVDDSVKPLKIENEEKVH